MEYRQKQNREMETGKRLLPMASRNVLKPNIAKSIVSKEMRGIPVPVEIKSKSRLQWRRKNEEEEQEMIRNGELMSLDEFLCVSDEIEGTCATSPVTVPQTSEMGTDIVNIKQENNLSVCSFREYLSYGAHGCLCMGDNQLHIYELLKKRSTSSTDFVKWESAVMEVLLEKFKSQTNPIPCKMPGTQVKLCELMDPVHVHLRILQKCQHKEDIEANYVALTALYSKIGGVIPQCKYCGVQTIDENLPSELQRTFYQFLISNGEDKCRCQGNQWICHLEKRQQDFTTSEEDACIIEYHIHKKLLELYGQQKGLRREADCSSDQFLCRCGNDYLVHDLESVLHGICPLEEAEKLREITSGIQKMQLENPIRFEQSDEGNLPCKAVLNSECAKVFGFATAEKSSEIAVAIVEGRVEVKQETSSNDPLLPPDTCKIECISPVFASKEKAPNPDSTVISNDDDSIRLSDEMETNGNTANISVEVSNMESAPIHVSTEILDNGSFPPAQLSANVDSPESPVSILAVILLSEQWLEKRNSQ